MSIFLMLFEGVFTQQKLLWNLLGQICITFITPGFAVGLEAGLRFHAVDGEFRLFSGTEKKRC